MSERLKQMWRFRKYPWNRRPGHRDKSTHFWNDTNPWGVMGHPARPGKRFKEKKK